jgi:hypothetical protein
MKARLTLTALLSTFCAAIAQDPAPPAAAASPATPPTPARRPILKYNVPKEVAAGERRDGDGGSRTGDKNMPELPRWFTTVLPASGKGLTVLEQPSLFTWQSDTARMAYVVKILEPGKAQPIFGYAANNLGKGFHRIDLSQFDVSLKPGVEYQWKAALRPDQKNASKDLFVEGTIKRIEPDAALAGKIEKAPAADLAAVYAEAGLWYDALAAIQDQIAANPKDKELLAMRDAFLNDANLGKVTGKEKVPDRVAGDSRGGPATPRVKTTPAKPSANAKGLRTDGDRGSRSAARNP